MAQFDAILWDVDGTLLDFLYSQRIAISKCLRDNGIEPTEEMIQRYSAINDGYWKRLELGEVTKEQLLTGRFSSLFEVYGITGIDVHAFQQTYENTLSIVYAYQENALDICKDLKGRMKQYVITNGVTAIQSSKLRLSGFGELMDDVFISEEIGIPKPQKEFFDRALGRVGTDVDKSRLLIVGDSLTSDIKGGVLSGIPTCWYRPDSWRVDQPQMQAVYEAYKPDFEISSLNQIYDILGIPNTINEA